MPSVVVIGAQWGDEGKGKVVDILSEFADLVVRFQGGANAGHTLVVNDEEFITHLIPSGIMRPQKRCAIGAGVVIDLDQLTSEIRDLEQRGLVSDPKWLAISERCHVVMPYHKMLDAAREASRGNAKIGTTLRGIGPCLEDKVSRTGIRISDLLIPPVLEERLNARLPELNALLAHYGREPVLVEHILPRLREQTAKIAPYVSDVGALVRGEIERGRSVLFEGAQGALLDVDHGTYPFVTSSNTVAAACCTGLGLGPTRIDGVVGLVKAYTTRVGSGPFPAEMLDERGTKLREKGAEYGATTGRPRRCGWLDLVALRYTCGINGCTSLCVTKLDVLGGIGPLRVAVGYRLDGKETSTFPADAKTLERIEPIYEEMEGWNEDIHEVREFEALPPAARRYLMRIESFVNVPVDIISLGASRVQTILRHNPFRRSRRPADV